MPSLPDYLTGFSIVKGLKLLNWELILIQGQEKTISKYHQYEYPLTLTFKSTGSPDPYLLLEKLNNLTSKSRIIYSRFGNPYQCDFGTPKITEINPNGQVKITTIGKSVRV